VKAYALALVAAACTAAHPHAPRARDGAIGGLARDRASGEPVGFTTLRLRGAGTAVLETRATREGLFGFDHLAPGRYDLDAEAEGARGAIRNIDVTPGEATVVDVELAGGAGPAVDFRGDPSDAAIEHFAPLHHDAATAVIEGIVADLATRRRVAGAVVTVVIGQTTLQTVTDDAGRYRFDPVAPGTYVVSAYYAVDGRGQMEVRRSAISVAAAQGVRVPLWIETQR
jgi:hypothetical protein